MITDEPVFDTNFIMGKFVFVKKVPEFLIELVVLVVRDLQEAIFDPERILVIIIQLVTRDLDLPSTQVFTIEQADPAFMR